jgi:alkylhydroperoxidase/carboxymuconolactone decarboxylase family protein YurZ
MPDQLANQAHIYLEILKQYDPEVNAKWGSRLERGLNREALDKKSEEVLIAAVDSIVHWAPPVLEYHVDAAFNAGSSIFEIMEAMLHVGNLEGGVHSVHDGLEALDNVVKRREAAGLPAPLRGAGLQPNDMIPESPWPDPPLFPFHTPSPRIFMQVIARYDPELNAAWRAYNSARFNLRKELTRRMQELLVTAVDAVIRWPEPLIDHHMHAAFECGCNAQEMIETILACAEAVQGARESNVAARTLESGVSIIHHGITALERVVTQRNAVGYPAPLDPVAEAALA